MWKTVEKYIIEHNMIKPEESVIVALSGGADSVALLLLLKELSKSPQGFPVNFKAVHIHHGLRGKEADRDAAFCQELCKQWEVPFQLIYKDVAGYGKEAGISLEEAGRILRYEVLEQEAKGWGATRIALAHHMDDQAETILHHLFRGSGLKGLGGIRPVQGNRIRPLLCVKKEEICRYLEKAGVNWCQDSTNAQDGYTRNRIRNQVLPLVTKVVNTNAIEHIWSGGNVMAQADEYLENVAIKLWEKDGHKESEDGVWISRPRLMEEEAIIRLYIFRHMIRLVTGGQRDVTARHYAQMEQLVGKESPGNCDLPGGGMATSAYEKFWIEKNKNHHKNSGNDMEAVIFSPPGLDQTGLQVGNLQFQGFYRKKGEEFPKNQYTKWFDYDKIEGVLSLRRRQSGDYIVLSQGGRKSVARYMIDEKIPRQMRDQILVLAEKNQVLWIVGYRISEYYKITEATSKILQASIDKGEDHGR